MKAPAGPQRKVEKLRTTEKALEQQLRKVKNDRVEAERIFTYRGENPALAQTQNPRTEQDPTTRESTE